MDVLWTAPLGSGWEDRLWGAGEASDGVRQVRGNLSIQLMYKPMRDFSFFRELCILPLCKKKFTIFIRCWGRRFC